jgi:hypothetical protein
MFSSRNQRTGYASTCGGVRPQLLLMPRMLCSGKARQLVGVVLLDALGAGAGAAGSHAWICQSLKGPNARMERVKYGRRWQAWLSEALWFAGGPC